jgi:hypothetical protein
MGFNDWPGGMLMKEYISATRLVTKIKMLQNGKTSKCFLIVEGTTDFRLYGKFIDQRTCEVIIGDSKSNVVGCIELCHHEKMQGVIGIVDADFLRLEARTSLPKNLFLTDYHDLECMLINSDAYEDILSEYANRSKYLRFEERKKKSAKTIALENTAKIGYLRWYSLLYNMGLKFSNLDFNVFVNQTELEIDIKKLTDYVLIQSKKQGILKAENIIKEVEKLVNKKRNLWDVCCGHDLIEVLSIGFTHIFGDYNAKNLFSGNLEGSFRLAYEYHYFARTELYHFLENWQKENSNYCILVNKVMRAII